MGAASPSTVWASILAFACILVVLGLLLCIPFVLARMRGVNPRVDRMMHNVASFMGADPPSMSGKVAKQPAPKDFLSKLKVTKYVQPQDLEAGSAEEDCCAICVSEYETGQPCITLSCGHLFHKDCILAWLKVDAVCPMCKTRLLPQPQQHKAPDCRCRQSSSGTAPQQQPQPATATAAASAPASAATEQELAAQASRVSSAAAAAAGEPAALPPLRVLPRVLQPHALSSPMLGVAGVSP